MKIYNIKMLKCSECKYSGFSKTVEYAYTCKNRISPCRNRLVYSDFFCAYWQKKEVNLSNPDRLYN